MTRTGLIVAVALAAIQNCAVAGYVMHGSADENFNIGILVKKFGVAAVDPSSGPWDSIKKLPRIGDSEPVALTFGLTGQTDDVMDIAWYAFPSEGGMAMQMNSDVADSLNCRFGKYESRGAAWEKTLSRELTDEQSRHVREHLTEEELTIFGILTRPGPELTTQERDEVKKVAHALLERLNSLLVLGWRQRVSSRAQLAIEDALDEGLPRAYDKSMYEKSMYENKCAALFEHVYESYYGDGGSVFSSQLA